MKEAKQNSHPASLPRNQTHGRTPNTKHDHDKTRLFAHRGLAAAGGRRRGPVRLDVVPQGGADERAEAPVLELVENREEHEVHHLWRPFSPRSRSAAARARPKNGRGAACAISSIDQAGQFSPLEARTGISGGR